VTVSVVVSGNPLPFVFEWRRNTTTLISNAVYQRFAFYSFINSNSPGTTVPYRIAIRTAAGTTSALFNITTLEDSDGDGIPDEWEIAFGGNPTNATDRNLDLDRDGLTAWQEYTTGTDPSNALSTLKVSLVAQAGQPVIAFEAVSNRTYSVQFTDRLGGNGAWSNLADVYALATNRTETFVDTSRTTNCYYRVVTPWQPAN
jgi:hypothetical protein